MVEIKASAPGKVILMGEHAAVYGCPAVVAAIGLRLRASLRELGPGEPVILELSDLSTRVETTWRDILRYTEKFRQRWLSYAAAPSRESFQPLRIEDPAHLVKIALGEGLGSAKSTLREPPRGIHLRIDSELPVGSGFGSSAAVAAAVLAVVRAWQGKEVSPESLKQPALEVDRRQHGLPSGVDTTTVLEGGILFVERSGDELQATGVEASPEHLRRFALFDSGAPAEPTGSVVAEVRSLKAQAPHRVEALLERMEVATRRFRRCLSDEAAKVGLVQSMRTFERCLEDLGVVPREVQQRVRQIEAAGGSAKISGAGSLAGPGAGSLLVYHPNAGSISRWPFLSDLRRFQVLLGDGGVRIEACSNAL